MLGPRFFRSQEGVPAACLARVAGLDLAKEPLANAGCRTKLVPMKAKFTYWKESDGKYHGYLHSHPDHWTQGEDLEDLKAHLRGLHEMFSAEEIPGIRQIAELEIA